MNKEKKEIEQNKASESKERDIKLKEILNKVKETKTYDAKEIREVLEDSGITSIEYPDSIEIEASKDAKRDILQLMEYIRRDFCYVDYVYFQLSKEVGYIESLDRGGK